MLTIYKRKVNEKKSNNVRFVAQLIHPVHIAHLQYNGGIEPYEDPADYLRLRLEKAVRLA